ncbi:type VI secretion system-associated protein [Chitinimonas prasina]|uniref:Type VI secretion system-associated protein n=1 Tax=Chitinimonas prasina TaxID=1434937 RepID=A0ABQ5YL21_9NEIS|nr:type VI secretion system baseplate subunit TssK [Chitinimonas prasina]GLR15294.1 type VI secretion system-associated protein [Chitinimonas prasina]
MKHNRVMWSEGLFLQPQHFQQQERHFERLVAATTMQDWYWGFRQLRLDESQLALGKLALSRANGRFRDGSPLDCGGEDALPPALEIPADARNERVFLAMPLASDSHPSHELDPAQAAMARYVAQVAEVEDNTALGKPVELLLGRLNSRLVMERDLVGNITGLAVARVQERLPSGEVKLDEQFLPPLLACQAHPRVEGYPREILGLLRQRASAMAARIAAPGRGSVAEVAEYLLLQTLNRYAPCLAQQVAMPAGHPADFHQLGLLMAGDLAIFAREDRLPATFPAYDPDNLDATLTPLMDELRRALAMVMDQSAVAIELQDRKYGVRVAITPDSALYREATFVLAARGQMPTEVLRQRLPSQIKIGPIDKIRDLVNLQLPGIGLHSLPVAPRQVPYHAGYHYFELDRNHELWGQLEPSGGVALHLAGEFPGLELALWAIRQ